MLALKSETATVAKRVLLVLADGWRGGLGNISGNGNGNSNIFLIWKRESTCYR